jgi:hypothetical protein
MRRLALAALAACLASAGGGPTMVAQSPSPSQSPVMSISPGIGFPGALEMGEALGTEVEVVGLRADMGQLWEGVELEPEAVTDAQMQLYRWAPAGSEDAPVHAVIEIVRFRDADEAGIHGDVVAASITDPLQGFEADLSTELAATGSFTSEEGFGGSTILIREGPVVGIVTVVRPGAEEMEAAARTVAALVLEGLSGEE